MFKTFGRRINFMAYGLFGVALLVLKISNCLRRLVCR